MDYVTRQRQAQEGKSVASDIQHTRRDMPYRAHLFVASVVARVQCATLCMEDFGPDLGRLFPGRRQGPGPAREKQATHLLPPYERSTRSYAQHRLPSAHIRVTGCRFPAFLVHLRQVPRNDRSSRYDTRDSPI